MRGVWKGIRDVGAAHAATAQQASALAVVSASRRPRVRLTVGGGADEAELVRGVGRGPAGLKSGVQSSFRLDVVHTAKRSARPASMMHVDAPLDRVGLLGGAPEAAAWRRSMCVGSSGETTIDDGIRACLSKKQHGRAIALFNKHPEAHAGISAKNYQGLLVAANALERWEVSMSVWHAMRITAAHTPNRNSYTAALKAMGKGGEHRTAIETFEVMERRGINPDRWSFATVISSCCEAGDMLQAERLFRDMADYGILPDATVFTALMKGYGRKNELQKVLSIVEDMEQAGLVADAHAVSAIVDAYVECGLVEEAEKLIGDGGRYRGLSSPQAMSSVMKGWANRGDEQKATAFLGAADKQGMKMDAPMYNTAISALLSKGSLDQAVNVMREMQERGIRPTVVTFSLLIKSFGAEGKHERAEEVFRTMHEAGVHADSTVYSVMIDSCARAGKRARAFELFWEMRQAGVKPRQQNYGALIKACMRPADDSPQERQTCLTLAFQLLDQMAEDGLDPNLIIYNVTLAVCVRNGAMSDVTHLYAEMKERGVAADLVTFGTLMAACAKHANLSTAESLLVDMQRAKIKPNDRVFAALAKVYVGCRQALKARRLLFDMEEVGVRPLPETYLVVIEGLAAQQHIEAAGEVLKSMPRLAVRPSPRMISTVIQACVSAYSLTDSSGIWTSTVRGSPSAFTLGKGIGRRGTLASTAWDAYTVWIDSHTRPMPEETLAALLTILTRHARDARALMREHHLCGGTLDKNQGAEHETLLERVVAVLNDMGRRGMRLGQSAYVDLMHLSAVSADPARALQMFAGMSAVQQEGGEGGGGGGEPMVRLQSLFEKEGPGIEGIGELLGLLERYGLDGEAEQQVAEAALQVCHRVSDVSEALRLVKLIQGSGLLCRSSLLEDSYSVLFRRFGKGEGVSKAFAFAKRVTEAGLKIDQGLFGATLRLASASRINAAELTRGLVCWLPFKGLDEYRAKAGAERRVAISGVGGADAEGWCLEESQFVEATLWPLVVSCLGRAGALEDALAVCASVVEANPKSDSASIILDAYVDACLASREPARAVRGYEALMAQHKVVLSPQTYMRLLQCQARAAIDERVAPA